MKPEIVHAVLDRDVPLRRGYNYKVEEEFPDRIRVSVYRQRIWGKSREASFIFPKDAEHLEPYTDTVERIVIGEKWGR